MIVKAKPSALKQTRWYEYAIRFVFGGLVTVMAAEIGKHWGPVIGGLFLAFPSIFPASLTLVAQHEKKKKEARGLHGEQRGKTAAAADAWGTTMGSSGLAAFALVLWLLVKKGTPWLVLPLAAAAWLSISLLAWYARRKAGAVRQARRAEVSRTFLRTRSS